MAAVNDVAANPAHIKKYKDNKKVRHLLRLRLLRVCLRRAGARGDTTCWCPQY